MYSLNKGIIENSLIKLKSLDWFIISLMLILSAISLIVLSSLDTGDKNLVEKHSSLMDRDVLNRMFLGKRMTKLSLMAIYEAEKKLSKKLNEVYICCDDKKIYNVAKKYSAKCILTSVHHTNGTERIFEAYKKFIEYLKQIDEDDHDHDMKAALQTAAWKRKSVVELTSTKNPLYKKGTV